MKIVVTDKKNVLKKINTYYKMDCKSHAYDHFQNLSKKGQRKAVKTGNHLEIILLILRHIPRNLMTNVQQSLYREI